MLLGFSVRAKEHFEATLLESDSDMTHNPSEEQVLHCYCHLVDQIESSSHTLGKDGKFQLFMCLCARWVLTVTLSPTSDYELLYHVVFAAHYPLLVNSCAT
jgi:hypothetical protein